MRIPDWTHFRSAEADPCGPCCMLTHVFSVNDLPRNYIWTLGTYTGAWETAEAAEINAQVKSYSREWLLDRDKQLRSKKTQLAEKEAEYRRLARTRTQQNIEMTRDKFMDQDAIKQRIEAGPLDMARGLVQTAGQLATGGMTDPSERMKICEGCPFMGADKRCGKCGCFLPAKTRVKKSSCPIGRW